MSQPELFHDLPLEEVIGDRFGRYSKYIIQDRALPDARDGLKPVQRRILYAMHTDGNTFDKNFRKAAKTVGNVIGNYHPHGDSSVYEAMVRMSQDWKVRNVLIEMHGNNGSIDGDPPAAMRYTEARLSPIASELLRDIDKNTVEFVPNFDDTSKEPVVLPAMFPNLLVNGSTGISAGYATDIPPHHLGEVIDAVIKRIQMPSCSVDELMEVIKGPDFPTGGIIQGVDGIRKASFGYTKVAEEDQIVRLASSAAVGGVIDVHLHPEKRGVGGYGTVHHVAFRTKKKEQAKWLPIIAENHLPSSEILDREYFTSVYFREKGGILFEIATDEPGFMTDETFAELGTSLKLPEWLEKHRQQITDILPEL